MSPDPHLLSQLVAEGLIPPDADWAPMQGGQTNRLWRVRDVVVKRFAPQDDNPRFPNDPRIEALTLQHLESTEIAPKLLDQRQVNGSHYLLYQHLNGIPWNADAATVGALLRRLHAMPAPQGTRQLPGGSGAVERMVDSFLPDLPGPIAQRLTACRPSGHVARSTAQALLHGDVVPGNIVVTLDGPRLIDWQCPAMGDPVEDLAVFLSPAMQLIYRGQPLDPSEQHAFLSAYKDPQITVRVQQMQPWHHWAMAAYCAWKSARGAHPYARAMELELAALE
ncbi:aminoglycoside phosphotransferase family protein [Thalassobius vesicularis]|uniref:Aminoglycoside phosphotransferase family protein n=1 Tax=Thalassobius vesicularis TaxID=1294297 RepID=A0A4S3M9C9_9RHOB|nr:aminoglycoside phosphotransferase family protein [Thalassobius vesicularis]THD73829.1 aminoglycoside phosphotransferase family protein [Thalassobius vesicularis]